ncbi:MAG: extracellular solute-binding protein [Patescibacteria group bacterium]
MKKYIIIGVLLIAIASPLVLAFFYRGKNVSPKSVTLNYWIVTDSPAYYEDLVKAYRSYHPYVKINFKKINIKEYENSLIQGWARDAGPDIFSLPNTWLRKYQEFITPLPAQTNVAYYETKKYFFQESVSIKYIPKVSITLNDLKNNYVDVVPKNVILKDQKGQEKIYALPYSLDTLALYFNKDLLNSAHLAEPARTWQDLVVQTTNLTKLDNQNNILQSAIALGLSSNVNNYFDILSLLMMQNGVQMVSPGNDKVAFNTGDNALLAANALDFYTSFADLNKETYAWNEKQTENLDSFAAGKCAYYIGYLSEKKLIEKAAPGLNFGFSGMLHVNGDGSDRAVNRAGNPVEINYTNFWVETVSKKTKAANEAWDFVQFIAREKRNKEFVEKTGKISPLKSILAGQVKNQELAIWAQQALTANNWYRGNNATAVEETFGNMIDSVVLENVTPVEALKNAANKINLTF